MKSGARTKWIIGIDEVGRGALAGPVVVAAAMLPKGGSFNRIGLGILKDSKKLTPKQREAWASYFLNLPRFVFAVARVYPRQIEKKNISNAANTAALRAFTKLQQRANVGTKAKIYLDGGLFLGGRKPGAKSGAAKIPNAKTLVKGDEKINAVKVASIVAKVHRDRLMVRGARQYPVYGFKEHKGYATRDHRAALIKYGPSPIHRLTFLGKFPIMNAYGRRTSKTSYQRKDGAAAFASRDEKTAPVRL